MKLYYLKSYIEEIAKGIERLIKKEGFIQNKKVILYGLGRYSFAMRTILSNLGYHNIECYVSDDETAVAQYKFEMKNFACRFLNQVTDIIDVWTVEERLSCFDDEVVILIASRDHKTEKKKLEDLGYKENIHFYVVYDFKEEGLDAFFEKKSKISLPEIKQIEKEMLGYVDRFCQKHDLRYWVCGGTLLGTIRHKGFIPWDDDIDVFLPWKDYLRFIEEFKETDRLGIMGFGTDKMDDFPGLFTKIVDKRTIVSEDIGTLRKINPLWIDVFPLVGLPEDAKERRMFFEDYKELDRQIWQGFYAANGKTDVLSGWSDSQRRFLSRYDFDKMSYVGVLGTAYGERDHTTRKVYDRTLRMQFEDIEINVPGGYKEYLDNLYGNDWMQLPDESRRKTHHDISVYWM